MLFDSDDNDKFNEKNDFFDGPDIPEAPPAPKKKIYPPDDPAFWDEDESQWEHLKPNRPMRLSLWAFIAGACLLLSIVAWFCFFSPFVQEVAQYGYVENIRKQGTLFKTYEGVILPYKELNDTSRKYTGDFVFSVTDRELFRKLRDAQKEARPVRVEYKVYHYPLPWRGESNTVVIAVDSVDPARILPPEFNR